MATGAAIAEDRPRGHLVAAGVLGFMCGLVAFVWFALIFLAFGVLALRHWKPDALRLIVVFVCAFALGFATLWVLSTPVNVETSGGVIETYEVIAVTTRWTASPLAIKVWVGLSAAIILIGAIPGGAEFTRGSFASLFWFALWTYLLIAGSKTAWWIVVVLSGVPAVFAAMFMFSMNEAPPLDAALIVALLAASCAVLLTPSARQWVARDSPQSDAGSQDLRRPLTPA